MRREVKETREIVVRVDVQCDFCEATSNCLQCESCKKDVCPDHGINSLVYDSVPDPGNSDKSAIKSYTFSLTPRNGRYCDSCYLSKKRAEQKGGNNVWGERMLGY